MSNKNKNDDKKIGLSVHFRDRIERVTKPYEKPLWYYDSHFKKLHTFNGTKINIRWDYRLKGFDATNKVQNEDGEMVDKFVHYTVQVTCPHCHKVYKAIVSEVVKSQGSIICRECEKSFVITGRGQIIYPETLNEKVFNVVSNKDIVLKVLSKYASLDFNYDVDDEGAEIWIEHDGLSDLTYELDRNNIDYDVMEFAKQRKVKKDETKGGSSGHAI